MPPRPGRGRTHAAGGEAAPPPRVGSLALPFLLATALVLALAATATCAVYSAVIARMFAAQVHERGAVVVHDIGAAIEQRMSLGLDLPAMSEIQDLIERRRALDPGILSIEVFDGSGRSLFNTDRGLIGEPVPERWRRPAERADGATWADEDFEAAVIGLPLSTSFGTAAGGVALRYSRTWLNEHVARENRRIALTGVIGFGAGLLIAALGFAWVLRPAERALAAAAAGHAGPGRAPQALQPLLAMTAAFQADVAGRVAAIDGATAAIQRIDDET
ncbi:hypothetical protein [Zavarzinia sp. CC-PAN008]|uniref:hypothetical protein n=1 Tax=Zavarzinia sp. CC-PAN008 TaxID=3243332 RepID=UPI003F74998B